MAKLEYKRVVGIVSFTALLAAAGASASAQTAGPKAPKPGQAICHNVLRSTYQTCDHVDSTGACVGQMNRQYTTICR